MVLAGCGSAGDATEEAEASLVPIRVAGGPWIELSPVLVAAGKIYPEPFKVGRGGVATISAGEADVATNAETQLLRESVTNPDLRIIMTVTESFYRLVGRKSAGIRAVADLKGKRVMVPGNTSAHYYLVAMLRSAGLDEGDVTLVPLPPADGDKSGMDQMSDALAAGDVDAISIWEPESEDAIQQLGDDAVVLQDRGVYREVFNLHTTATALADPEMRRSIVAFVRSVLEATDQLKANPAEHWPLVQAELGYPVEVIEASWPEMEFPADFVPDLLDVLETEEVWVAKEKDREPRSREELAGLIDGSVLEEARGK